MSRKMRSYPSKRAVDALCPTGGFCLEPCTGRDTCERINPAYDPDWRPPEPAPLDLDPMTDEEWALLLSELD